MITSNEALYEELRKLITQLVKDGEKGLGNKLKDAMAISTVPGEILGEIRGQLRQLETMSREKESRMNAVKSTLAYRDKIL